MRLTAEEFETLLTPPSIPLQVVDHMAVWIDTDTGPSFTGLVLRIKHPDLQDTYDQLFRLTPKRATRIAQSLLDHSEPPTIE